MKIRIISLMLTAVLLGAMLLGSAAVLAETEKTPSEVFGTPVDAIAGVGKTAHGNSGHGGNQNRVVRTSRGTYLGIMTENDLVPDRVEFSLVFVDPAGNTSLLYNDYIAEGSHTITIMADNEENVWVYSGFPEEDQSLSLNLWKYDPVKDKVTNYNTFFTPAANTGGYGYSVAFMDAANNRIIALAPGGDKPGIIAWAPFDIAAKEWLSPHYAETEYRHCYLEAFAIGSGFVVMGQRDATVKAVKSDLGISVFKSIEQYQNRKLDANYMWDDLNFLYVPEATGDEMKVIPVVTTVYDAVNGIYPNTYTQTLELYKDLSGNLHAIYLADDDGVPGAFTYHKIFRIQNGDAEELAHFRHHFLYGEMEYYYQRMYEDSTGRKYIVALPQGIHPQLEIWYATDDLGTEWRLACVDTLEGGRLPSGTGGCLVIANARNNSVKGDVTSVIISSGRTWYEVTIDFAAVRARAGLS